MTKARSNIAKGRGFQRRVLEKIKECFGLDEDDCRTAIGAETGTDIKFTSKARKLVGLSIECKDVKSLNVWSALKQAQANTDDGTVEAVIFKRGTVGPNKTYIVVPLDHYLEIRKDSERMAEEIADRRLN
jgi:hypothetical protein